MEASTPLFFSFREYPLLRDIAFVLLCFVVVLSAVVSLAVLCYYVVRMKPQSVPGTLPGPWRVPGLGMLPFAVYHWKTWPVTCTEQCQKYRHKTWGGPAAIYGTVLFTDNPINIKHILKDNFSNYVKGDQWRSIFRELMGNGIFAADGLVWETHRKISSRLFSRNLLKYSCTVISRNCQIIVEQLEKAIMNDNEDPAVGKVQVDLQDQILRLTLDSSAETTFGVAMKSLQTGEQPVFGAVFEELQKLSLDRMIDPFFEVKRFFQLTRDERRIRQLTRILDKLCQDIIEKKRKALEEEQENLDKNSDLLSLFLKYSKQQQQEDEKLADQELRDVILNFLVAGRDTSASALSWTFYELTRHPAVVDKIVTEVNAVCGVGDQAVYNYDTMNRLPYTHAVAMEALRLHPPVPSDSKTALQADTLPDGTPVKAGALITYLPIAMGRSTEIWGEDAVEFKPERFVHTKEPSMYQFTAFNAGPRMCLGKPVSLLNMKLVMAHLLPKFKFDDVQRHSGEMDWFLVQKMKGGFPVEVSKRLKES